MAASTWSTTDKSASLTLTGSNLIATAAAVNQGVRGKDPKRTGKYYVEYTSTTTQSINTSVGFATFGTSFFPGQNASAIMTSLGQIKAWDVVGGSTSGTGPSFTTGSVVGCAIDLDAALIWFRLSPAGNWNNSATNNPATGVGGVDISTTGVGRGIDAYPFTTLGSTANSVTANFGGSAFTGAVPSGFTSGWDDSVSIVTNMLTTQSAVEEWASGAPAMQLTQSVIEEWGSVATYSPYTTWSQSDKSPTLALSNSDLTATSTSTTSATVRTVGSQISGRFYWEYTFNVLGNSACGIASQRATLGGQNTTGTGPYTAYINMNGTVFIIADSATDSTTLGTFSAGGIAGIALDLNAKLIWFRNGAGNWNNSASANPATGVGGFSVPWVGVGIPAYGLMLSNANATSSITGNFGASAFSFTAPAGYTLGFPTNAGFPVNTIATQLAADTWAVPPAPAAQLTNISIEQWAQVATTNPQAIATQVFIDQWASASFAAAPVTTPIPAGAIIHSGQAPVTPFSTVVGLGTLTVTGKAPTVIVNAATAIDTGSLTFTGRSPAIPLTTPMGLGKLAITGKAPTLKSTTIPPGLGAITFQGLGGPSSRSDTPVGLGRVAIAGLRPVNIISVLVPVGAGTMAITGYQPFLPMWTDAGDSGEILITGHGFEATAHLPIPPDHLEATFKMARDPSEMNIPRPNTDWFFRHMRG